MNFLPPKIDIYAEEHTSKESELLYELNRQTNIQVLAPRMLSGHIQGRMLSMFSQMIQPKTILEIGTYTGYSALCFAEGLQQDGTIYTIEIDPEIALFAQKYFDKSEYSKQIKSMVGDATELIEGIKEELDLVFIDADKSNYINYYNQVLPKLRTGGYIIVDNVLWSGKVVEEAAAKDKDTQVLQELNDLIQADERVENVLLPLRDGLMVVRKV
jgi:caffeoyl-CoA O-methyltransferase